MSDERAVYATSSKHIDTRVDRRVNLTALSVWLFIGDIGSVTGSNTWPFIAPLITHGAIKAFCVRPAMNV